MADISIVWSNWVGALGGWRASAARRGAVVRTGLRRRRRALLYWATKSKTALLNLSGFGFLAASAWVTFGLGAGLAAIGLASLALELLSNDRQ